MTDLNPLSTSMHVLAYLLFCFSSFQLHKKLQDLEDGKYLIGPVEVASFMLVPFFYIFWNSFWVEHACRTLESKYRFRQLKILGLHGLTYLTAMASPLAFPDNMDRVAPPLSLVGFIFLFWLTARIQRLALQALQCSSSRQPEIKA